MNLSTLPTRILLSTLFFGALLAPRVTRAQIDDPGLEAPPPPSGAPPRAAPAPRPAPTPAAAPSTPPPAATPRRSPGPLPPMGGGSREAPMKEEVKEEVSYSPTDSMTDDEWEARVAAPTVSGGVGLLRMQTAEVGKAANFRLGLHMQAFTADSFLVAGSGANPGDSNQRFIGDLTIGVTGPDIALLRNLELYLGIFNSSNQNKRTDAGRTDPSVILALGDVGLGLRGAGEVAKGFSIGGNVNVRFFNSISGVLSNFDATTVSVDLLAMLDIRRIAPKVPLRFHLNLGYLLDRSQNLLPAGQCAQSNSNDACIRSRVVETFAYGLGAPRLRFALGIELPFRPHAPWGIFGIAPFFEYHIEHAVGDGDLTIANALTKDGRVATDRINSQNIQYGTLGLRLRPAARLIIDLGLDLGFASPGFQYGPPVPAWNVILGASYAYDLTSSGTKVIKKTITRTYAGSGGGNEGKIRGIVRDARSRKALAGAIIRYPGQMLTPQATGDDGTFLSYGVPAGTVQLEVSRDDYAPLSRNAEVEAGREEPVEILLTPKVRESRVRLKVTDEKGGAVVGGTARFVGPVTRDGVVEGDSFTAALPPGDYAAAIDAPGFLAKEAQFNVQSGRDTTVEIKVRRRPLGSHVQVTKDSIVIKGVIHFGTNNNTILPDGQQLLDEVADVLAKNRQIRKLSVEGHTDNRGIPDVNLKLSKARAAAVVEYLIKAGIGAERLQSDGFGATRPLVPNLTPLNRARNRRVDFKIVDQGAAFPQ